MTPEVGDLFVKLTETFAQQMQEAMNALPPEAQTRQLAARQQLEALAAAGYLLEKAKKACRLCCIPESFIDETMTEVSAVGASTNA